ncbi:MAG: hypothetical protein PHY66_04980 [Aliarcobacter sp.]|nr:hypothetical protein [Aliarcobacter sp.]
MQVNGLTILINNFEIILSVIIVSIIFFILYEKYNSKEINKDKNFSQKEISKKNLYLNRIDIIGNKVGTIFFLIILTIVGIIYLLLR